MVVAVTQPYFFSYIGYFQLVSAVDQFVFYDDVNFIKNGWINRNRVLVNNTPTYLTVQLKDASSFKKINEVEFTDNRAKLLKTIKNTYSRAPYYNDVIKIIESTLNYNTNSISELAIKSVMDVSAYIGLNTQFEVSSKTYAHTANFNREDRLVHICKEDNAKVYINPIGGQDLYTKEFFREFDIDLKFIQTLEVNYKQFGAEFHPWLSIIDVLMFNSKDEIVSMLKNYELV